MAEGAEIVEGRVGECGDGVTGDWIGGWFIGVGLGMGED